MHLFLFVYRESMATTTAAPMNCVLFHEKKSREKNRSSNRGPSTIFSHLFFTFLLRGFDPSLLLLSRWCVAAYDVSLFSHFSRRLLFFLLLLERLKLRLMTNFVKLVLKCYQLMAILNESNYYYQQQNGRVWTKRCATHCRCLFYAIVRSLRR